MSAVSPGSRLLPKLGRFSRTGQAISMRHTAAADRPLHTDTFLRMLRGTLFPLVTVTLRAQSGDMPAAPLSFRTVE